MAKSNIYLDSGATSHMTNQPDWLEDYEELNEAHMKVGNRTELTIKGKGSLPLTIKTEEGDMEYDVPNVLYVPELTDTLISIGEIAKEGHTATFSGNAVKVIFDKGSSLKVERKHGLYALDAKPRIIDEQALVAKTNAIDKANLWHYRLGHPGHNIMRRLGIDVLEKKCKACEMAKSHKQPFNK